MIPAGVLHAPGSMCTYEPQWGSDVFGMYQSLVEGREVPWDLLVKDVPKDKHRDLDFIVEQLDLGEERRSAFQGAQLRRADRGPRVFRPGLYRPLDRLRPLRRRAVGFGQGADGDARGEVRLERSRRERLDHRARQRPAWASWRSRPR